VSQHRGRRRLLPEGATGRTLVLDDLVHSYVNLEDPLDLRFYVRIFGDVVDASYQERSAIDALHVGGGGFSFPRYLAATRPGSRNRVIEVDPGVTKLARDELALRTNDRFTVLTGDARLGVRAEPTSRYDLVVGDAFGGVAVPWHLTTREFIKDIRDVLTPRGSYIVNMIDFPPTDFVRAEIATLGEVFDHVVLIAPVELVDRSSGGNFIVVASDAPIDESAIDRRIVARRGNERLYSGADLADFVGGARPLTDDHAPVDQLLTPPRERS
jgi:spermidine synthase